MSELGLPERGRIAYGAVRGGHEVFVAENIEVLARVLAVKLVARLDPSKTRGGFGDIQEALLEERWADALLAWMGVTGEEIDIFDDQILWTDERMSLDDAFIDIRMSPIFRQP